MPMVTSKGRKGIRRGAPEIQSIALAIDPIGVSIPSHQFYGFFKEKGFKKTKTKGNVLRVHSYLFTRLTCNIRS